MKKSLLFSSFLPERPDKLKITVQMFPSLNNRRTKLWAELCDLFSFWLSTNILDPKNSISENRILSPLLTGQYECMMNWFSFYSQSSRKKFDGFLLVSGFFENATSKSMHKKDKISKFVQNCEKKKISMYVKKSVFFAYKKDIA